MYLVIIIFQGGTSAVFWEIYGHVHKIGSTEENRVSWANRESLQVCKGYHVSQVILCQGRMAVVPKRSKRRPQQPDVEALLYARVPVIRL